MLRPEVYFISGVENLIEMQDCGALFYIWYSLKALKDYTDRKYQIRNWNQGVHSTKLCSLNHFVLQTLWVSTKQMHKAQEMKITGESEITRDNIKNV